ncbi:MAG TPA: protein-glutamate O-methyltransferase CheR [Deltaproteobacteria bacterium]|jgi:chemotaxis protein methyltransferase CheR|nr:protein-glutamate O-methyltransferase CheR [Deltaproteobacteria bacterium]
MTPHLTELEFKLLRDLIYEHCGIFLTENKAYLIENRLANLLEKSRSSTFGELYLKARTSPQGGLLCMQMVDAITTNETSWFRDEYPYHVLRERILPEYDREIAAGKRKRIDIWSAACSTGQEPYSTAITILDFYSVSNKDSACHNWVHILATDISATSLAVADEGKYDAASINRGLQQKHLDRYFKQNTNCWKIDDRVKEMISFKPCNLKSPVMGEKYDIIFLRNVMIYFPDSLKRELFNRMAEILAPNGYLFLGTGETTGGYTTRFEMVGFQKAIYYRRKPDGSESGGQVPV